MKEHKTMCITRSFITLIILLALIAVPVSASTTTILSIPDHTSIVYPSDGISTLNTNTYGPLNIPQGLLVPNTKIKSQFTLSSSDETRYNLVKFDNPISIRSDTVTLTVTLYGIPHLVTLERVNYDTIDDGIDSYYGTISDIPNASVVVTVGSNNLVYMSIDLPTEHISVYPVQNREYTLQTPQPLHIVYSSKDVASSDAEPIEFCGVDRILTSSNTVDSTEAAMSSSVTLSEYDWAYVHVRVVTDSQFYQDSANWRTDAAHYIANANIQFQRDDIKVTLVPTYDESKRTDLSSHSTHLTRPWDSLAAIYPETTLNNLGDDICLYLGGYVLTKTDDNEYIGMRYGRYCWVRMPGDAWPRWYDGSEYARSAIVIHELGHVFGAHHPYSYSWDVSLLESLSGKFYTVMTTPYQGETRGHLHEFSSVAYHGTSSCDNAGIIRSSKHQVSATC